MGKAKGNVEVTSNVDLAKKRMRNAMNYAAEMIGGIVEGHAKELCPVDTGVLRNSILHLRSGETETKVWVANPRDKNGAPTGFNTHKATVSVPAETDEDKVSVYIGTPVEYAPYVELGHHQQPGRYVPAIGKRLKQSFVKGKPFLRPACENSTAEINKAIEKALKQNSL